MNQMKTKIWKGIGAIVLTLAMLITMLPVTDMLADTQDITGPVIESWELKENGSKDLLSGESQLHFSFSGYDQDSEIVEVRYWVSRTVEGNRKTSYYLSSNIEKGDNNIFTTWLNIPLGCYGDCNISTIEFVDSYGNISEINSDFSFFVKKKVNTNIEAAFSAVKNNVEISNTKISDVVEIELELTGYDTTKEIAYVYATPLVSNEYVTDSEYIQQWFSVIDGRITTSMTFDNSSTVGVYRFGDIYIIYNDGTEDIVESSSDFSITFENSITDKEGPIVSSIVFEYEGKILEGGEILETGIIDVTLTATDDSGLKDEGVIRLDPGVENAYGSVEVPLKNDGNGKFKGIINIDDLYNCDWEVGNVFIYDFFDNESMVMNTFVKDLYFGVIRDGVYQEGVFEDVNIILYDDFNGSSVIKEVVRDIPRSKVSLGSILGSDYVELEDSETYGEFLGWMDERSGEVYTKDSLIKYYDRDGGLQLYPKYRKSVYDVACWYLSDEGLFISGETIVSEKELTYKELFEYIGNPGSVSNSNFMEWNLRDEEADIDEDKIVDGTYVDLIAIYDKYPISVQLAYLDECGELKSVNEKKDYPAGTTYQQILDEYAPFVSDWRVNGWMSLDDEISILDLILEASEKYEDKHIVRYIYWGLENSEDSLEYAEYKGTEGYMIVSKEDATSQDILSENAKELILINHFKDLTCKEFSYDTYSFCDDAYADWVMINPIYEESMVNLYANGIGDVHFEHYYVVEAGERFYLPAEYDGEKVYWYYEGKYYTGSIVIPSDDQGGNTYYVSMQFELPEGAILHENEALPSTPSEPSEPSEPTKPSKPSKPTDPSTPSTPSTPEVDSVVKLEEEKVAETTNKIKEAIKEAEKNESTSETAKPVQVVVDMKKEDGTVATEVPKEILEAAKGQNVEIVLDMGGYSWTINGKDIKATNLKDINLEVELGTKNIPSATVEKIAKGQETHQLSLTHNGHFGFKANLTINVGKEKVGKFGNLYYYDSDGKLVFMNAGKIDENGNVSLAFSHASEYVVVISDKAAEVPDTGDNTNVGLYLAILFAGVVLVAVKKRRAI